MAVILESKTQSEEELTEALEVNGYKPETKEKPVVEETKPVVEETKPSEQTGAPGDKSPAETESEAPAGTEPAETKPAQEKPQDEKPKTKGGYQAKLDTKTRQLDEARDALDLERGDKTKLQRRVDELEAEMAKLKPAEPEKPAELVRPKRPTLKEADFDQDKLDSMMDEYESKLDAYNDKVADKKVTDKMAAFEEGQRKKEQDQAQERAEQAYFSRLTKGKTGYEDFDELAAALPDDVQSIIEKSQVVRNYTQFESEDPVHLVHFFMKDYLENDGAEGERIMKMNPYQQVKAIVKIEERLIGEQGKSKEAPVVTEETKPAKTATPEETTPAKPKTRAETPDAPIRPVSGSATTKGKSLDEQMREAADAGNSKEFQKLLAQQHKEKYPARV